MPDATNSATLARDIHRSRDIALAERLLAAVQEANLPATKNVRVVDLLRIIIGRAKRLDYEAGSTDSHWRTLGATWPGAYLIIIDKTR